MRVLVLGAGFGGLMEELAADKVEFGCSRIQRWFGRAWPDVDEPVS